MNLKVFKNKIFNILFISALAFLINIKSIEAKNLYIRTVTDFDSTDIIENNKERDYFILCSYGCTSDNSEDNPGNCGEANSNFSIIKYDMNAQTSKMQIEMNIYLKNTSQANVHTRNKAQNVVNDYLWDVYQNGIYFEEPRNMNNLNESWTNRNEYNELNNNFVCPKYFTYDKTIQLQLDDNKDNDMELCYANSTGLCESRNEKNKTNFDNANRLIYNLNEDLNKILVDVEVAIKAYNPEDFLLQYYETSEDICNAMKNFNGTEFGDMLHTENYKKFINENLDKYSATSPNHNLYTFDNLTKLSATDIDMRYNGISLKEKFDTLDTIYQNKQDESVKFYLEKCEVPENLREEFSQQVREETSIKITKVKEELTKILDYSELDCDNLFSGVADIIKNAYFGLEVLSIVIVLGLTALDYAKIILSDNKDEMKKANGKLAKRVIILVVILLLPALINLTLRIFNIQGFNSEHPLCIEINK